MMDMDIDKLSLDELRRLNKRVVMRIRYLHSLKTQAQLDSFQVGDRVSFQGEGCGHKLEGGVTRINRKTLTVHTPDGHHWTIHPHFLTKRSTSSTIDGIDIGSTFQEHSE